MVCVNPRREGVNRVNRIFDRVRLAPPRAAAPRDAFEQGEDPRIRQAAAAKHHMRYAAAFFVDQLNSVPSTHMRCRMTASLRATGTLALRSPLRLASLIPQAFSADHFGTRVSSTLAASNGYVRSMASPHFEIRPDQSTSPEA